MTTRASSFWGDKLSDLGSTGFLHLQRVRNDVGARRVPLCFADAPVRDGFRLGVMLDTGESYTVARLGGQTEPFFSRLVAYQRQAVSAWQGAHRELERNLEARPGEAIAEYQAFQALDAEVQVGLFSADDEAFWFVAVRDGRAAVEQVCDEQTATYPYRFATTPDRFVASLRHAMEAVKRHRRLIFLSDEELDGEPLYRMSVDRSSHVRFLRGCNAGRIVHTTRWNERLQEFFS